MLDLRTHPDARRTFVGTVVACLTVTAIAFSLQGVNFDVLSGVLTLLVLVLLWIPLLQWVARREGDRTLFKLLCAAWVTKMAFSMVRYFVITRIYNDTSDAPMYSYWGSQITEILRSGSFVFPERGITGRGPETERVAQVVGVIYLITGVSRYAATFVFTSISFGGQLLMWRAFRRAVPEGDDHRYALLVFFLPSLLFWPSSIGKDALMIGCIGVASYGAAQLLAAKPTLGGVATFLVGSLGLGFIRPHMALIALVSLVAAAAVGSLAGMRRGGSARASVIRFVALLVLLAATSVVMSQVSRFFNDGSADEKGITAALEKTQGQTTLGGSEFEPPMVKSPLDLPVGVATVLFRPFPWEARSGTSLMSVGEGLFLLVMVVAGRRRFITWVRLAPKRPYLVYAATYAFAFIVAFSYIGNFGILARQRTQMLPLFLTALAMPLPPHRRGSTSDLDESADKGDDPSDSKDLHGMSGQGRSRAPA